MPKLFKRDRASYLRSYHKKYKILNKDKIQEAQKKYREKNESRLRIKRREYYEKNKDLCIQRAKARIRCDVCNIEMNYNSQFFHKRSNRHMKALSERRPEGVSEAGGMLRIGRPEGVSLRTPQRCNFKRVMCWNPDGTVKWLV
jgi:hypothetical protein